MNNSNSNGNGKTNESIPTMVSMQQLEELATLVSQPSDKIQPKPPNHAPPYIPEFEQPAILKQSKNWSRAILWT
ncbi:MAG: hemolysin D, partial [Richelia sp. RM1_1_1]|nr:hemolysin D [Richelia sp. RM1_1_1]